MKQPIKTILVLLILVTACSSMSTKPVSIDSGYKVPREIQQQIKDLMSRPVK